LRNRHPAVTRGRRPHRATDGSRPDVAARTGPRITSWCTRCGAGRRRRSGRMGGGLGLCEACYASDRRSR